VSEPLLLDTHCWVWMQFGLTDRFTAAGRAAIRDASRDDNLWLSVISIWEVGLLESKGRLALFVSCERWVDEALAMPGLRLAQITPRIALQSTRLPGEFHGDPADRILVATAMIEGARLLTKDRQILSYGREKHVGVLHA
jgi:PIN domain nuclease of toxin-antitoxin system